MLGNEIATTRPQTTRHLLDLSEDEKWRYIEAKEKGDLEEQMKIHLFLKLLNFCLD